MNRNYFKLFNLKKEVRDTIDYVFKIIIYEIHKLTKKKIGKGTVKSFYYSKGNLKFNIIMSIKR